MSEQADASLSIGTRLSGPGGLGACRVGGFAQIADDTRFALTVWHAFVGESNADVHLAGSSRRIGAMQPRAGREQAQAPFWTAIGLVRLDPAVKLTEAAHPGDNAPIFAIGLNAVLGRDVHRFGASGVTGRIVATHGILRLTNPLNGHKILYEDTLEVRFNGPSGLTKGDAGSLVTTDTGDAVGLIVAGATDVCYVAPLEPLLATESLRLIASSPSANRNASEDFIMGHNRHIRDRMRAEEPFDLGPMPGSEAA